MNCHKYAIEEIENDLLLLDSLGNVISRLNEKYWVKRHSFKKDIRPEMMSYWNEQVRYIENKYLPYIDIVMHDYYEASSTQDFMKVIYMAMIFMPD